MGNYGIFIFITLTASIQVFGQGSIKGKIYDSLAKHDVPLATITVFRAKDTSIVTYRLSNTLGDFRVPGLPQNVLLRAVITSSGYKVIRKEFTLKNDSINIDWGVLLAQTDTSELEEVLVTAERPPVSFRKDTIEFNASAFKTLPTAIVEDLLKKLPGVEIDPDGNIRVNGRVVNRIMVDGKDFFGGDPRVASKNLPANLIDKVQVVDDKDQKERNPDIAPDQLGQVINLKLKKSIKKGWFGKVYAGDGQGAQNHYETGAIINSFRDTLQISILGYTNNINKSGFSLGDIEKLGGFGRSGYNSLALWSDGGVAVNGISFGGTGKGIQSSNGAGINISHDPSKKLKLSFQYYYGKTSADFKERSNTQQNISDTIINTNNNTNDKNAEKSHMFAMNARYKMDSLSNLNFNSSFFVRNNISDRLFTTEGSGNLQGRLYESISTTSVDGKGLGYSHNLFYSRRLKSKKGRSFNISNDLTWESVDKDQFNSVLSTFYKGGINYDTLNQHRKGATDYLMVNGRISFNEPFGKKNFVILSVATSIREESESIQTFDWDPLSNKYNLINPDLTNSFDRHLFKNTAGISSTIMVKKLAILPSVNTIWLNLNNKYIIGGSVSQNYFFVQPGITFRIGSTSLTFRQSVREPYATDLSPVIDNTNPLYQNLGNPDLLPAISNILSFNSFKNILKKQLTYNVNSSINIEDNSIVRERTVSVDGIQITKPVNVDGVIVLSLSSYISKQFKLLDKFQLSLRPSISTNHSRSYVIVNSTRSKLYNFSVTPSFQVGFNFKDLFELSQNFTMIWNKTKYESTAYRDLEIVTHRTSTELVVRLPKNWVWESTLDYRYNPLITQGISKTTLRWNAGINYLFLKSQKGQLKFFVFDLLKQNNNVSRMAWENYTRDVEVNTLTRYFMVTFTYNIRDFKAGKVGGRQSMFFF